jgi:hypothetical protein
MRTKTHYFAADLELIATMNDSQNKVLPFARSRKRSTAKISPVSAERSYLEAKIATLN